MTYPPIPTIEQMQEYVYSIGVYLIVESVRHSDEHYYSVFYKSKGGIPGGVRVGRFWSWYDDCQKHVCRIGVV